MLYVLICLCLSLAGVAGLQFFYMVYMERIGNDNKKRIVSLERRLKRLNQKLIETERSLAERDELIGTLGGDFEVEDEEIWADVIDDR